MVACVSRYFHLSLLFQVHFFSCILVASSWFFILLYTFSNFSTNLYISLSFCLAFSPLHDKKKYSLFPSKPHYDGFESLNYIRCFSQLRILWLDDTIKPKKLELHSHSFLCARNAYHAECAVTSCLPYLHLKFPIFKTSSFSVFHFADTCVARNLPSI